MAGLVPAIDVFDVLLGRQRGDESETSLVIACYFGRSIDRSIDSKHKSGMGPCKSLDIYKRGKLGVHPQK
jgi:hypothetical protein